MLPRNVGHVAFERVRPGPARLEIGTQVEAEQSLRIDLAVFLRDRLAAEVFVVIASEKSELILRVAIADRRRNGVGRIFRVRPPHRTRRHRRAEEILRADRPGQFRSRDGRRRVERHVDAKIGTPIRRHQKTPVDAQTLALRPRHHLIRAQNAVGWNGRRPFRAAPLVEIDRPFVDFFVMTIADADIDGGL